jgi:hypothetical protein
MTLRRTVKKTAPRRPAKGAIVVVIASPTDLRRADVVEFGTASE